MPQIQAHLLSGHYRWVITSAARQKTGDDKEQASRLMASVWKPVAATGATVTVVADNPGVSGEAVQCVQRVGLDVNSNNCGTSRSGAFKITDPLLRASQLVPGSRVIDLSRYYCTDKWCPSIIGHVIVYRDPAAHITGSFAATLAPYLAAALKS